GQYQFAGHGHGAKAEGQQQADQTGNADIAGLLTVHPVGGQADGGQGQQQRGPDPDTDQAGEQHAEATKQADQSVGADPGDALAGLLFPSLPAPLDADQQADQQGRQQAQGGLVGV